MQFCNYTVQINLIYNYNKLDYNTPNGIINFIKGPNQTCMSIRYLPTLVKNFKSKKFKIIQQKFKLLKLKF